MEKSLSRWQTAGFVFTGIVGTLLHFAYEWTGRSPIIAAFSAVNESTWEHMKILFFPMFIFALIESYILGKQRRIFWCAKLAGTLVGLTLIPIIFYTYTGVFGVSLDWVNIAIFFVAAAAAYMLETRLLKRENTHCASTAAFTVLWLIAIAFVVLTYVHPPIPLFRDPTTGTYGLG